MAQEENHIKRYSAEDLERYHSGRMTVQEMNALEKAALDDPFLSDALDGYAYTTNASGDIDELKRKLPGDEDRKKIVWGKRKTIPLILKIAAISLLFAGLSWLLYKNNKVETQELATFDSSITKKEVPATTAIEKTGPPVEGQPGELRTDDKESKFFKAKPRLTLKDKGTVPDTFKPALNASSYFSFTPEQLNVLTDSIHTGAQTYTYADDNAREKNTLDVLAGKTSGIQAISPKMIKGRITDQTGNAVSFATVLDKKTMKGSTDKEGAFTFLTNDSAPKVEINAVGYESFSRQLSFDSNANNLVLSPSVNALNEVVVVGPSFSTKKAKPNARTSVTFKDEEDSKGTKRITVTNAIPVKGWQDFNKYTADSLKTIEQLGPYAVNAEILVTFNVDEKGNVVDIEVNNSLCRLCEKEVIRVLKGSPPWKLNLKSKRANAIIRF